MVRAVASSRVNYSEDVKLQDMEDFDRPTLPISIRGF